MGALAATMSAVGGGEAGLLGLVGIVAALLGGVLSLWRERVEWRRAKGAAAPLAYDDISERGASFLHALEREAEEGEGEEDDAAGVQRRVHAKVVPPPSPPPLPFRPSPQPQQPLTIENVRAAIREELVIVRNDIKNASKWTFWTGVGQGFILYVLGIAATLIISG